MSFEEARHTLVIALARGSISEEEFLILYEEYELVNPFYPLYWDFNPFLFRLFGFERRVNSGLEYKKTAFQ